MDGMFNYSILNNILIWFTKSTTGSRSLDIYIYMQWASGPVALCFSVNAEEYLYIIIRDVKFTFMQTNRFNISSLFRWLPLSCKLYVNRI